MPEVLERVDVAYVFIVDEQAGQVLLVHNDDGRWSLPGGQREPGETFQEAARREAREETGLEVAVGEVVHVSERLWQTHDLFVTFRAHVVGGTLGVGLLGDVQRVIWQDLAEAQRLLPFYGDLQALLAGAAPYQSRRGP